MGEVTPGVASLAVVLADRAPLPLAQVGSPFLPGDSRLARIVQPLLFRHIDDRWRHLCPLLNRLTLPLRLRSFRLYYIPLRTFILKQTRCEFLFPIVVTRPLCLALCMKCS